MQRPQTPEACKVVLCFSFSLGFSPYWNAQTPKSIIGLVIHSFIYLGCQAIIDFIKYSRGENEVQLSTFASSCSGFYLILFFNLVLYCCYILYVFHLIYTRTYIISLIMSRAKLHIEMKMRMFSFFSFFGHIFGS